MKLKKIIGLSATAVLITSLATGARADEDAQRLPLVFLEINTLIADTYLQYHGKALTMVSSGIYEEFRWGGASCGSRTLSEQQVAALQGALDNPKVKVAFRYQYGQGEATKCVVGFSLARKGYIE